MKTPKIALTALFVVLASAVPALAADRGDHSGLLVWAFLGLCALIVVAQLAPAALMVCGLVRGLVSRPEAKNVLS
jgi:hypothetical protein